MSFQLLETTVYRAPLGLQFIDAVTGAAVADDLVVTAWPAGDPTGTLTPTRSPISANFGFGMLPGIAYNEALIASGGALPGSPPGPDRPFEVRVVDPIGRFLPALLAVTAPQPALVTPTLYSAPTRPAPSGWAKVSGEVWATSPAAPAAWAVVEVTAASSTYTTLADQLGRYVVYLPYPEALPPLAGSPPSGGPLDQITWPISVTVRFQPSVQNQLPDSTAGDPPELGSLLGQAPASIQTGGGLQSNLAATLTFGIQLLLMLQVVPA